jgi:signal peptide peptidase SppA
MMMNYVTGKTSKLSSSVNAANSSYTKLEQICKTMSSSFSSNPVVSVIRLSGVIANTRNGLSIETLNEYIEKAFKKSKLVAVCLCINSPGGSPAQSELIANRIISLAKERDVRVYSFVEDVAASGGYWLACAGEEIYALKSSIVGSIGVISRGFGFQDAISKIGVERRVYTAGSSKSILDPFEPAKASDVKMLKGIQKKVHTHFIDYVKTRRRARLTQSDDILFNGEFWTGETALDFGLIDGFCDMYSFIREKFGDKVKIDHVMAKSSWFKKQIGVDIDFARATDAISDKFAEEITQEKFKLY